MSGIIGEAVVVLRPTAAGFGTAARKQIDAELGGQDLFSGVAPSSRRATRTVEDDFAKAGRSIGDSVEAGTTRAGNAITRVGTTAANWGIPFAGSLKKVGDNIADADTKGQKLNHTVSALGGTLLGAGVIGAAAIAGESVHLAEGLQAADAAIAGHENISTRAANNITRAFENTAGTLPFSANELASAFAPVSGELSTIQGRAVSAGQALDFVKTNSDLAEASGSDLGGTMKTTASIMQAFNIPLKDSSALATDLYNTSRATGEGVEQLGTIIDRLKARLGVAAPTVGDLSTLLVDLNEHGVQGARGLLVVNTAMTTLLNSVPKVTDAEAKQANQLETKLTSASDAAARAQSSLATTQENAAARVAKAEQNVQYVEDRIAASRTANAPTTAQQIELANAQAAVTAAQTQAAQSVASAQTRAADSATKLSEAQAAAATSTNPQVRAMQELGLQVYNANGTFVGMRSIIEQLAPKLHGMTQEQQLATTAQIFGQSAAKSLLDTILAGPAAYDRAAAAVHSTETAHKAYEKQAGTLHRELDVLGAAAVDEGDKFGLFVIPKLQDVAKWSAEDVRWLGKHKDVLVALGIVAGGFAAVSVGTFLVNVGVKWVTAVGNASRAVTGLATNVAQKLGLIQRDVEETTQTETTSAEQFQTASTQISEAIYQASNNIIAALANVDASINGLADSLATATTRVEGDLETMSLGAKDWSTGTQLNFAEVDDSFAGLADRSSIATLKVVENYDEMSLAAKSFAEQSTVANAEAGASAEALGAAGAGRQLALPGVTGIAPAAEEEAAGGGLLAKLLPGGAGAAGGLGSLAARALGPASIGLIGVQLYNSFAEKKLGHLIGTNAASALGDAGVGASIGAGIGSVVPGIGTALGAGVGAAAGVAFAERKPLEAGAKHAADFLTHAWSGIGGKTGITGDLARIATLATPVGAVGAAIGGLVSLFGGGSAPKPHPTELQENRARSTVLGSKLDALRQLQQQAFYAAVANGANSAQAKAALQSLYATENKWFPHLAHDESLKGVNRTLFIATAAVNELKAKQAKLAQDGTIAQTTKRIDDLKSQLKLDIKSNAAESTLKDVRTHIHAAEGHLAEMKSIQRHISRDETTIRKADETKASIEKVNIQMTLLRNEIRTMPPPKQHVTGRPKLKVTR